ncbi:Uncharacterised protein [Burkholderia pseudomallei]|nr:Uncharacterised protein [Burkholderia pseudomallei]
MPGSASSPPRRDAAEARAAERARDPVRGQQRLHGRTEQQAQHHRLPDRLAVRPCVIERRLQRRLRRVRRGAHQDRLADRMVFGRGERLVIIRKPLHVEEARDGQHDERREAERRMRCIGTGAAHAGRRECVCLTLSRIEAESRKRTHAAPHHRAAGGGSSAPRFRMRDHASGLTSRTANGKRRLSHAARVSPIGACATAALGVPPNGLHRPAAHPEGRQGGGPRRRAIAERRPAGARPIADAATARGSAAVRGARRSRRGSRARASRRRWRRFHAIARATSRRSGCSSRTADC